MAAPNFNMHSIKRKARKEAWANSSNPFARLSRSSTAPFSSTVNHDRDLEAARNGDGVPVSLVQTEPTFHSARGADFNEERSQGADKGGMSKELPTTERTSHPESARTSTARDTITVRSDGPSTRRRKIPLKFWKHQNAEEETLHGEESTEKKRPWYKGKILPHKEPFTLRNQLQRTLFGSWINILLLAVPAGIAMNYAHVDGVAIFCVNFIAIIPLAGMLGFATEEIALHVGESLGGLLNATFGNAVEMIVAIIALAKDEITVVQTSLIGSVLSNLLLVLGMSFFFGGLRRPEQFFNKTVAQTSGSLLALAIGALIIPTCFDQFTTISGTPDSADKTTTLAALSRGTSVILLVVYVGYLYFQLHTHSDTFLAESQKVPKRPRKNDLADGAISKVLVSAGGIGAGPGRANLEGRSSNDELINPNAHEEMEVEQEEPQLHIAVAWATLAIVTAFIGLCAEFMVDGIGSVTGSGEGGSKSGISVEFVGLILLPIVGNSAEHATSVTVACKDKMDLAIGVCVGSSMQVSLFLIPLLVVIGWIMGKPDMNLSFDGFQVTVMFVAVLLANYLLVDGKSLWIEGMILMCLYLIIAVCAFYYPEKNGSGVPDWS
ncbi:Sodium/calcium exchanger protein-domain-containing protein [Amylocarpus encephaloides]|uniref:Sodium/calcium exchanger protein-domain-containing protein n=1 Tax=Amylocarpus encephaloides TaxID=45428 RepID=A0A9P7YGX2_9HELO|nr:Sodium/calcium exchanger protein-domain-containing protein [Amylocarpus encephaloides]